MSQEASVSPRKVEIVEEIIDDLNNYSTIGLIEMVSIGASTVQKLRAELRGRAKIKVAKNTLMKKALELIEDLQGAEKLSDRITGPVAFLFTNESPYRIANFLEENKVAAPAKSGQIAPKAVTIPKQNTGMPPGTIISELNSVGLPTRIESGTVAIPEDTQVLEAGDRVSTTLAAIMSNLGIEPFEVGLSIALVLEDGDIIDREELLIDFDAYINDLKYAHQAAVNLSVNAGIITDVTAPLVIGKAKQKAMALAASIGYVSKDTASVVFGRAQAHISSLARALMEIDPDSLSEEAKALATSAPVASAPSSSSTVEEEEEEEEEPEEDEGEVVEDDGLGSLFG